MKDDVKRKGRIRKIKIRRGYMKFADGSCMIEIGNTKVICTASVEPGVPPFLRGKGTGWITAEYGMLPKSCKARITRESSKGRIGGRTHEIQRLIGRSFRSIVDLSALGERTIWLDCDVIQGDGGTRTASITGSFIALVDALISLRNKRLFDKLPIKDYVAAVSVGMVDGKPVLDLDYEQDFKAEVDMNVVMTGSGRFIEVQGTAERAPFTSRELDKLVNLAKKGVSGLIEIQKKVLGKDAL